MNRPTQLQRSRLLAGGAGALATATLGGWSTAALAQSAASIKLPYVNSKRSLVAFPEKRPMIVLTSRPAQLETPWEVFNEGIITPNDAFFLRYHNSGIPASIDIVG